MMGALTLSMELPVASSKCIRYSKELKGIENVHIFVHASIILIVEGRKEGGMEGEGKGSKGRRDVKHPSTNGWTN